MSMDQVLVPEALVVLVRRAAGNYLPLLISVLFFAKPSRALELEGAYGHYSDETRNTNTVSESTTYKTDKFFHDQYKATSFNLGVTVKKTDFVDEKQIPPNLGSSSMQE